MVILGMFVEMVVPLMTSSYMVTPKMIESLVSDTMVVRGGTIGGVKWLVPLSDI